jgi:acetylornithine/succinyldiaminopimelate/putrescine aminotransferase
VTSAAEFDVYKRLGIEVASASGMTIRTADDEELLDFYGGHAVCALGHSHPRLVEALKEQMDRLLFQTNLVEVEIRRRACDRLAAFAPPGLDCVFLCSTGAEANENALRIAFSVTGRRRVVALEGGFHGRTAAAAACTSGSESWYGFPQAPFEVDLVPVNDEEALDAAVTEETAAVICEPVQGVAGAVPLSTDYMRRLRRVTEARGAIWIADEVQCGMGRTGRPFAVERTSVHPDILTTAKGLGGGFPVAAVIARVDIAEQMAKGSLGTTFGGGPLAAAAVLAVLDVMASAAWWVRCSRPGAAASWSAWSVIAPRRRSCPPCASTGSSPVAPRTTAWCG